MTAGVGCIWCPSTNAKSLEHIAPESLGCPAEFVLREGVCENCNGRLGRLDRALLVPFEIITVMKGIPRKKGRRPTVDGFSSISSGYDENGPRFQINREKYDITPEGGKRLKGITKNDPITEFRVKNLGDGRAQISYNQELRFGREAVRGIFKIAIESIAFFEGLDAARDPELDAVKAFVTQGTGDFRVIMVPDPNPAYESYFAQIWRSEEGHRGVGMTILGIGFLCGFDPEFGAIPRLLEAAKQEGIAGQVIPNWPKNLWRKNNIN
jgi:hypothetical protein